jgi:2-amino-4-hydroxy-6-hydroxymethyldihydropteridine diphosphokinase
MEALIGLGGNLGDVRATFLRARASLAEFGAIGGCSSLWRSQAVGPPQPDYLNAAVLIRFACHPARVLELCQDIESALGRERATGARWGPRPLDLDLLIVPGIVIESTGLTLPHPQLHLRRFALLPATELAPAWRHPRQHRTLADIAGALDPDSQPCERLGEWEAPRPT